MSTNNGRTADYPVAEIFLARRSPRAFTGAPISHDELMTLFEAARWAPSSNNAQPWRFLYAHRDTPLWDIFLGLLAEGNKSWAKDAAALVILLSKTTVAGKDGPVDSYTHSFDAGAAWGFLALQAEMSGWAAHAMGGYDRARAVLELDIPEGYWPECMIAIGRKADPAVLSEAQRAREMPNGRAPIGTLVREGTFAK